MTPEERLEAIVEILARGLLRLVEEQGAVPSKDATNGEGPATSGPAEGERT